MGQERTTAVYFFPRLPRAWLNVLLILTVTNLECVIDFDPHNTLSVLLILTEGTACTPGCLQGYEVVIIIKSVPG